MTGWNELPQTCGMVLGIAAALSALLGTEASTWPFWLCEAAPAEEARNSWQPWLLLTTLGLAAGVGAVLYPLPFAAPLG